MNEAIKDREDQTASEGRKEALTERVKGQAVWFLLASASRPMLGSSLLEVIFLLLRVTGGQFTVSV